MKQLTDEVFAQVRDALKPGITRMNILGEARPCTPLHEAIAALDTAQPAKELAAAATQRYIDAQKQPEPVNAMLVEALETLTNNCKGCCPSKAEIGNAALAAAKQAQPVCGYDDTTGNCTRVNCCKQAQPERVTTAMVEGLQNAADKLEVIQARGIERDKCIAAFEQAQPERAPLSDDEIQTIYLRTYNEGFHGRSLEIAFARAIEAAIKQGGQHE